MTIGFITENNLNALREMRKYCFSVDDDCVERSLKGRYTPENYIGYFDDNILTATVEIRPYRIFFHGHEAGMGGIAWVTSLPEYRHGGRVRKILQHCMILMRERKQYFSFLGPFSYEFYRKLGWGHTFTYKEFFADINELSTTDRHTLKPVLFEAGNLPVMNELYKKVYRNYNGPIIRSDVQLKEKVGNRYCYLFYSESATLEGYIIFDIHEHVFRIEELVVSSGKVRSEIFSFIMKHTAQAKNFTFITYDDNIELHFKEHRTNKYSIKTKNMVRVIDVYEVLKLMKPITENDFSLSVKVIDKLAPWNNNTFVVRQKNNTISISIDNSIVPDIVADIDKFSQLAMGVFSAESGYQMGFIDISEKADFSVLNKFFYKKPLALFDSF